MATVVLDEPSYVVRTSRDVGLLLRHPALRNPVRRPPRLQVAVPALDETERRRTEHRLNTLLADCGCATGKLWLVVSAALLMATALPGVPSLPLHGTARAALVGGVLYAAAVLGKLTGIWRARQRACDALASLALSVAVL